MLLEFDAAIVRKLLAQAVDSQFHIVDYQKVEGAPGLELVGDFGSVYLLTNAYDRKADENGTATIAYARGSDPDEASYDRSIKDIAFGSDDGVVHLAVKDFAPTLVFCNETFYLDVTPTAIKFVSPREVEGW